MASPMGYDGGLTCALEVKDLNQSIAWYRDVLGFQLLYQMDDLGWCELRTEVSGVNIGLSQVEKGAKKGGGAVLTFGVRSIEEARNRLEKCKVRFDGETRTISNMVKLATFFDPDGNTLMLYEDLQKRHGT